MLEADDIHTAAQVLKGVAHRTPVLTSRTLNGLAGASVFAKAEQFQRGGAFKFRGAFTKIAALDAPARRRGVAAFSSGNHAQGVAIAARELATTAVIVMPHDTPAAKIEATRGYGAEVVVYDRYQQDREAIGRELAEQRGLTLIPPYEDPLVMAGQGTAALELIEEAGPLDVLIVPVGGGGLIAGCATIAKALLPGVRVVGVEPTAGNDTQQSLAAGKRVRIPVPRTIADGQQADIPGEMTFEVNRRVVDEIVTVTDDELVEALRFCFDHMKTVLEPSGACGVAALLSGALGPLGDIRAGVILSGGNVGVARFCALLSP